MASTNRSQDAKLIPTHRIFIVMPFIEHDLKTLLADMPQPFLQSEIKTIMLQLLSAVAHCHSNWIVSASQVHSEDVHYSPLASAASRFEDVESVDEQPRSNQSRGFRTRSKVW